MKPNWFVVLLVGVILGLSVTKLACNKNAGDSVAKVEPAPEQPVRGGDVSEAALAVKSAELSAGTFEGMNDAQKYAVMKVLNDNQCNCGCDKGSLANCVAHDPGCPNSPKRLKEAVELAKAGKTAAQIQAEMFGSGAKPAMAGPPTENTVYRVPIEGSPVKGKTSALVTMVEFSDYQCPFCSRANTTVTQLEKDYGDKLRLVMKQNPLPFHEHAQSAALAAMAAGQQGKYWEMHEKLFANQEALDDASIARYAEQIGLNVAKWNEAMKNPKLEQSIRKDQALAASLGASGTPAFFINGRKLVGAQPIDSFKAIIDQELNKAQELVNQGVKPDLVYAKLMENAISAPVAPTPPSMPAVPAQARKIDVPADSPAKGPKNAKVTIVEWSDFQCPFCGRALPTVKQIEETYPKDVRVVFRHQPLPFHPNAKLAAEASMAAHQQGKFWAYHDKLFANQQALDRASLEKYASEVGLKLDKFKAALDSGKFRGKVEADSAAGSAVGANGTPTFFINGRQLVGAQPFPGFKTVIDEEIVKANKLIASGVKPDKVYEKLMAEASTAPPPPPPSRAPGGPPAPLPVQNVAVGSAPVKGSPSAPVTIVEFSDFQCPFCSRAVPTLKQIETEYPGKVRVAFKNQPLPFHQHARLAAEAAMAANEQGKFWEYHDKLFANQQALDRSSLERYAQEVGLDLGKFRAALDSNKFDAQISADSAEGTRLGASGTPTFFINGRQLVGAQPFANFKQIIDEELVKNSR